MQENVLVSLIQNIQIIKAEKQNIELKSTKGGFPKRIYDTLSAFSNQDEGGILIFGVTDKPAFEICGVYDAEDVQKKIMESCLQMEPPVRAVTTICEIEQKLVVAAEIPGVELARRPVYYAGTGITKGSFVRVGDGDRQMTPYEIYSYEAFRKQIRDDLRLVERAKIKFFNDERIGNYLEAVKKGRKNLANNVADEDILELMGVTQDNNPTLAGAMCFSQYPQAYFPQLCITAVAIPGIEMGEVGELGERFIDNQRITGAIPDMLEEAMDFVRRNCRVKTIIDNNGKRADQEEYPLKAIREAILNALVHRDYSIYTEGTPISIEMYRDRIEIKNPGGLYGYSDLKDLGNMRPETRNPALTNMLELLKVTENRYSGIPTMLAEAKRFKLPDPEFLQRRGEFIVIFRNNLYQPPQVKLTVQEAVSAYDGGSVEEAILKFCEEPRSRAQLIEFLGMSRFYVMAKFIQPMVEEGKLALTLPDKPKSSKQRYKTVR